jgi:hypothetical protein
MSYAMSYAMSHTMSYTISFIQQAARLLHQPTLLPSDGASKLQLPSALTLERAHDPKAVMVK